MFCLTYVSSAVELFSAEDLRELLLVSRQNNERDGISGMLLYKDGNFMQVLEGEETKVLEVFERICGDGRHTGMIPLHRTRADSREFPEWSMGFRNLDAPGASDVTGYSQFLDTPLTGEEFAGNPTRAQKLLLTFKKKM